jgi:hypothetical protein
MNEHSAISLGDRQQGGPELQLRELRRALTPNGDVLFCQRLETRESPLRTAVIAAAIF